MLQATSQRNSLLRDVDAIQNASTHWGRVNPIRTKIPSPNSRRQWIAVRRFGGHLTPHRFPIFNQEIGPQSFPSALALGTTPPQHNPLTTTSQQPRTAARRARLNGEAGKPLGRLGLAGCTPAGLALASPSADPPRGVCGTFTIAGRDRLPQTN